MAKRKVVAVVVESKRNDCRFKNGGTPCTGICQYGDCEDRCRGKKGHGGPCCCSTDHYRRIQRKD